MKSINLTVKNNEYKKLKSLARKKGRSIKELISDLIHELSEKEVNIKDDPLFNMVGYESDAPKDLSRNIDKILYN